MGILAKQSVIEKVMSFTMHLAVLKEKRTLGIADGKYAIPDDIDECNDENIIGFPYHIVSDDRCGKIFGRSDSYIMGTDKDTVLFAECKRTNEEEILCNIHGTILSSMLPTASVARLAGRDAALSWGEGTARLISC